MSGIDPTRRPALLPVPGQQGIVRPMFRSLGIAASGISAQRQRMETIAQNIANADVTRGTDGQPFKRRAAVVEAANAQNTLYPAPPGNPPGINGSAATNAEKPFGSKSFDVPALEDAPRTTEVPLIGNGNGAPAGNDGSAFGVRVAGVAEDEGEGRLVYEPGHPDANESGYVRYPEIETTQELVNLLDAKRLYEANASVFQTAKSMLRAALDI